jgi:hypothetical protein
MSGDLDFGWYAALMGRWLVEVLLNCGGFKFANSGLAHSLAVDSRGLSTNLMTYG